jgi:hypothetical protein
MISEVAPVTDASDVSEVTDLLQPANPDVVVDLAGDGALAFVACLVRDAVYEAARGDPEARQWLERCAIRWLRPILDGKAEATIARLLAALPETGEVAPATEAGDTSEGAWVQLGLWGESPR